MTKGDEEFIVITQNQITLIMYTKTIFSVSEPSVMKSCWNSIEDVGVNKLKVEIGNEIV